MLQVLYFVTTFLLEDVLDTVDPKAIELHAGKRDKM
jgi:hypothetical protein